MRLPLACPEEGEEQDEQSGGKFAARTPGGSRLHRDAERLKLVGNVETLKTPSEKGVAIASRRNCYVSYIYDLLPRTGVLFSADTASTASYLAKLACSPAVSHTIASCNARMTH